MHVYVYINTIDLFLVGGVYDFETFFKAEMKKGKEYWIPVKTELTYVLKRAYFQLDNLFNGNKLLGMF